MDFLDWEQYKKAVANYAMDTLNFKNDIWFMSIQENLTSKHYNCIVNH